MKKILCCTVIYDAIKFHEKDIIQQFKQMKKEYCEFLIVYDRENTNYENEKDIIQLNNTFHYNPIELREYCIEYAFKHGFEYFVFCDADDIQLSNKLEILYNTIIEKDLDFVSHNMAIVNRETKVLKEKMFPERKNTNIDLDYIADKNVIGLGNSIFKTASLKGILPLNTTVICDWWIGFNLLLNGGQGILITDILSYYVQYDKNIANLMTVDAQSIKNEYQIKKKMYEELQKKFIDYTDYFKVLEIDLEKKYQQKKESIVYNNDYWWNLLNC